MLSLLATCVFLAAGEPAAAPAPEAPRIFANEGGLAVVLGYELSEVSFVALHCTAMERYTQQVLAIPPIPGVVNGVPQAKGRLEIVDLPGKPDVSVQVQSGQVVVSLRLADAAVAAQRAAEAAARTWVGRVAFAAGQPVAASEPWVAQALASETRALLRPALVDYWYREGRLVAPARVADILQGKAPEREAFLFWRALRHDVGLSGEQTRVLIAAAQGRDTRKVLAGLAKSEEDWWLVARANLLLTRSPVSLGMRESAEALAEATRFVFDLGAGDVVLTGPQAVRQRDAAGVQKAMEARLLALRREILRQNPVYHNAWRTLGAWLERFPKSSPEELDAIWADFQKEWGEAEALRKEIQGVLAEPTLK
ncbi:MAG: hypothetical protein EBR62_00110 [Verrucomicrobia bacterium]|nr:hypothetical protein [Verrucomicrobiota bacterium]